ncbi:MAG: asparagine synthase (glutamine-hydrolyzing) [Desulfuromonas sp.]|uniref:asparagine synthase (glutamine-hydrolyzing) n=1 Tax=Desulfuromonas sp. TaxID=892 RepID=UPI000CC2A908|nr:asparagine synthase (glutamine-hydrolyzing) [Desulfuromonas sp.]PLX84656.1 MAG: asparagine synthase (glutamine-hydrolyzing) [Desulfuromonas sp.]
MCGIAGFALRGQEHRKNEELLSAMARTLAHRGPDDEGFFHASSRSGETSIGLAHRRLSIIDLAGGHQPLGNEDGSIQIVFNGEVYNFASLRQDLIGRGHRFLTNSDTETVVHAYEEYGEDCVDHLRGMFAFAIWDANREKLLLARDRFGKKPLFVHQRGEELLFASEIKAILSFPGVSAGVDRDALWDYLAYRYVPGPATLFAGIRKLPPGTVAVWEDGKLRERTFYRPPDGDLRREGAHGDDPVGAFLDQLDESVAIRMVSDVPFGAFLSGGIDSSAVVALMARHSNLPVKTFSVGFREEQYSELSHAALIAREFRTEHQELVVSQDHLMDELEALVRFRDAPVAEPSDIPIYLLAREARKSVKMVLTGEGSDEVLGGYPKHVFERYVRPYQLLPAGIRHRLFEPLVKALPYRFRRAKTAIVNLGLDHDHDRLPRWFGALSHREREQLVAFRPSPKMDPAFSGPPFDVESGNSALRRILYFDQTSWLPDNLLERGDRMTMAASLEARMPFMDHELAAFASSLPDRFRVRGRQTKWILREAMKRILPESILERPKVGFRVPVNEWFRGPMRDYLCDHLTGPGSLTRLYYRPEALNAILDEHVKGRQNHEKLLWTLLNLEIWHRQYGVTA